eukprot:gene26272-27472_t
MPPVLRLDDEEALHVLGFCLLLGKGCLCGDAVPPSAPSWRTAPFAQRTAAACSDARVWNPGWARPAAAALRQMTGLADVLLECGGACAVTDAPVVAAALPPSVRDLRQ